MIKKIHDISDLVQDSESPGSEFHLSHDLNHAPSFSTRGHLVQDLVSLDGKISLDKFPRLVKF